MSKTLVIVESPTKAKTISKFLDASYTVTSSFGHVRDLPKSTMGIDTEDGTYEPTYIVSEDKEKKVQELKKMAARADEIIFATDEDREGEAISWHLAELFGMNPEKVKRIVFHEITKDAILHAIKAPRHIDTKLVDAQQARRVIDRLVGYELSPLLWKKISRGLSAGRVQSVAVRLIVEREREIRAFTPEEYWTLEASLQSTTDTSHTIMATLHSANGSILKKLDIPNKEAMDTILQDLAGASYIIDSIEEKETQKTPPPPFSTSTLQQTANNVLGYSSKYTMRIAQTLYEGIDIGHEQVGLITYMRTDSLSLSDSFLSATTKFVQDAYGQKYTINAPRTYKTKKKGAQEAHEAIRPTDPTRTPASLAGKLDGPELKLYTLIWNRTVATQMAAARLNRTNIHISAGTYGFKTTGQTMLFDGWMKLYPAMMKEAMLPALANGTILN
jgi:DNA topoisomerase-1